MIDAPAKTILPGFYLERTAKMLKLSFQRKLKEWDAGITADQWVVLHTLHTHGALAQVDLAKKNAKDAPTLTRIIDLLVDKEYVIRASDPEDARRWIIRLTDKGTDLVGKLLPRVREFRQESYKGLDEQDLMRLKLNLETISKNLDL